MEKITEADETALSEIYDRYHRLVFGIALNTVENRQMAEEITLDVFIRVWKNAGTYRLDRGKVSTWLTRLARNRAIDILRQEAVRPEKHSVEWADTNPNLTSHKDTTEGETFLNIQKLRVRTAVAALPPEQKEALALAYFKGYTHSEIAKVLDQPLGTIKARIRAGMKKLRVLLEDDTQLESSISNHQTYNSIGEPF